jgi:hypothetical protein
MAKFKRFDPRNKKANKSKSSTKQDTDKRKQRIVKQGYTNDP